MELKEIVGSNHGTRVESGVKWSDFMAAVVVSIELHWTCTIQSGEERREV
jgi:hypothetical protein